MNTPNTTPSPLYPEDMVRLLEDIRAFKQNVQRKLSEYSDLRKENSELPKIHFICHTTMDTDQEDQTNSFGAICADSIALAQFVNHIEDQHPEIALIRKLVKMSEGKDEMDPLQRMLDGVELPEDPES